MTLRGLSGLFRCEDVFPGVDPDFFGLVQRGDPDNAVCGVGVGGFTVSLVEAHPTIFDCIGEASDGFGRAGLEVHNEFIHAPILPFFTASG